MMPRIEAQETLSGINMAALAAGGGEPLDRARIFAELDRKASGETRAKAAGPDDLNSMGLGLDGGETDLPAIASIDQWLGLSDASEASETGESDHG